MVTLAATLIVGHFVVLALMRLYVWAVRERAPEPPRMTHAGLLAYSRKQLLITESILEQSRKYSRDPERTACWAKAVADGRAKIAADEAFGERMRALGMEGY